MKNILLLIWNFGALLYSLAFLYDYVFNNKVSEGYEIALSGVMFFLSCIPMLILYAFKIEKWHIKIALSMMFLYLIISFIGTLIPIFVTPILASIFIVIILVKTFYERNKVGV